MAVRQIALDTETTGRSATDNRIIEIGAVEIVDREVTNNNFQVYINPQQEVEAGALRVHGLTDSFLQDKPLFSAVVADFISFISGAELIIHNATFDVGFIDAELKRCNYKVQQLRKICKVLDTLPLARKKHPGQRNSLDALCKRYEVDNSSREYHGALLDSVLLADVYLRMTSEQNKLFSFDDGKQVGSTTVTNFAVDKSLGDSPLLELTAAEISLHEQYMADLLD